MTRQNTAALKAAEHLHRLGANITAIPDGQKEPGHDWNNKHAPWATQRQPVAVVRSLKWNAEQEVWNGRVYPPVARVGIVNGIADWRTLDLDARTADGTRVPVPDKLHALLLARLGLATAYAWSGRSASGAGLHAHLRSVGELPEAWRAARSKEDAGVIIFDPLPEYAGDFDHLELRWERCQTVLPALTGYNGHIPDVLPDEVPLPTLVAAVESIATPRTRARPAPAAPATRARPERAAGDHQDVIGAFNARFTCGDVLERNGYDRVPGGWSHPDTSQPGEAGIKAEGDRVRSYSATDPLNDGAHSHDAFGCKLVLEHNGDMAAAVRAAADELGLRKQEAVPPAAAHEPERATDLGNARRLVRQFGDRIRYVHTWGAWLVWDGARWVKDETGAIHRLARDTIRAMYAEAAGIEDPDARKALGRWATQSEGASRLSAMVELARSEPGVAVHHTALDADPWLLNCANGTIDLRTGALRPHNRDSLLTKLVNVDYDPQATAPTWGRFMERITSGDARLAAYIQQAAGYTLTGDVSEQCLFFCYGTGANGKSTFVEALSDLLGGYWLKAPAEMLMQQRHGGGIPNDIARLPGARMVVASEISEGRRLDEAKVKDLTGGDTLVARFMKQEYFEFRPVFKLWMYGNYKPVIRGTDNGIWRRIRLIPFMTTIPDEEKDPTLPKKLRAELPGILAWAVRGCLAWQRDGLDVPDAVRDATDSYRAEMDVIGDFLTECCTLRPTASVAATPLYKAYVAWCEVNGERPLPQKQFGQRLDLRGLPSKRTGKAFMRQGVALLAAEQQELVTDDPMIRDDPKIDIAHEDFEIPGDIENGIISDHRITDASQDSESQDAATHTQVRVIVHKPTAAELMQRRLAEEAARARDADEPRRAA